MTKIEFRSNNYPTLGVELELGLIDSKTMELSSAIHRVLEGLPEEKRELYKPELMQCCLEINTGICHTVAEAEEDLSRKVKQIEAVLDKLDLRLWWGATHPFSKWSEQKVTPNQRYLDLLELLQEMARRLVTQGLHVHVGVESGDKAVMICDRIMQYLPLLLSLSSSSPFWEARDTGLASHRTKIMEGLPTAGIPTLMRNWSEYVWIVNHMVDTGFINTIREIWWDVRPHHNFGTVEVRVCDMPGSLEDVLALTAMTQCLIVYLSREIDEGAYQHDCHPMMVRQNKWRAARFGTSARLVNSFTFDVETVPEMTQRLVTALAPLAKRLQCVDYLEHCNVIANRPSWASQQRTLLHKTGSAAEMVRILSEGSRLSKAAGSV
ncbi:YbdK family carboxylate-amine ligase [Bremerella cremea]|uniref:Putative glutamate--cysteine ligase 2 n=1 Tax=Blastopirellula marina TaxID=124 RepID=A0A2S8G5D3_9BACT|nr:MULTISPECIES: YbdK family carboxylate-amine ligase [Pirellulaceae]PQO39637.1 glutamate--cysteine ligase [Blastopirellula marina]RCS51104.1 YbdK family carboxylate-amine ligase [Bremerella cremea]